ncbi:MAG: integrase [Pseudohongiella sp.]|nr:integrase [Pseudohongiella sp.]|tara:strand:- start:2042 stop:2947 length:906 start_codon:yes stop_codon:yes gene_type:complete
MIDKYITEVVPRRHIKIEAERAIRCHLTWWRKEYGQYLLVDITPKEIGQARDELLRSPALDSRGNVIAAANGVAKRFKSNSTVTRYLASLSVVYTVAVNEWGWLEHNPVRKVERPAEKKGRVRFLSDNERLALLEACQKSTNKFLYPVVVLALSTGARKNEIMKLRWRQVDLQRNVIRLEDTKNKERRALPLVGLAHQLIGELMDEGQQRDGDLVFPNADGSKPAFLRFEWDKALQAAGIEDFRFHDLRHSAASYLAMNGATLAEIAEVLGHKTLQMVKRYAHMSEQHTISVVERMNKKIF